MIFVKTFLLFLMMLPVHAVASTAPASLDQECIEFIKSIEDKYNYGWVEVAETPSNFDVIKVFYYYKKSSKLQNPVLFYNGGPGYTSHGVAAPLEIAKIKFGDGAEIAIDFIFMDQRGTGCSTHYPVGASPQAIEKLKWYGSSGIVMDSETLRSTLFGNRKWKIFGQSFGGHIVYRYLKMHPEGVLKAYSHGYPVGPTDFDYSYARIASQATVLTTYYKLYPNDQSRLKSISSFFSDPTKCFKNKNIDYCGFENLRPLVYLLGFRDQWPQLHLAIISLAPAGPVSEENVSQFIAEQSEGLSSYHGVMTNYVDSEINKYDISLNLIGVMDSDSLPLANKKCSAIYSKIESVYKIKEANLLLDECKAPIQFQYEDSLADFLKNKLQPADINFVTLDDVKSALVKSSIPLYLYSGSLDSFVPKELFQEQVTKLGKLVNYTNFLNSGHEGFFTEKRVLLDLAK